MVQPWSLWSQGWGRSEETQDGFRSVASIPRVTVLCMLVFPNLGTSPEDFLAPFLYQGTAEMSCGSTIG